MAGLVLTQADPFLCGVRVNEVTESENGKLMVVACNKMWWWPAVRVREVVVVAVGESGRECGRL